MFKAQKFSKGNQSINMDNHIDTCLIENLTKWVNFSFTRINFLQRIYVFVYIFFKELFSEWILSFFERNLISWIHFYNIINFFSEEIFSIGNLFPQLHFS